MKTILIDAIHTLVSPSGELNESLHTVLESYPNTKIIVTNADDAQMKTYNLQSMPYEVFTLKHSPEKTDPTYFETLLSKYGLAASEVVYIEHLLEALKSAQSLGIDSFLYDAEAKNIEEVRAFLVQNLSR